MGETKNSSSGWELTVEIYVMNGTHQVLAYADDVNLIGDDIRTKKEMQIGSNSYEKVKTFKYLGSLLTNQNYIQEEIKCRLKEGYSCYY